MSDTQKTCLITGASRGLGHALAQGLADAYHLILVARTVGALEELDDLVQAAGGSATLVPLDITDRNAVRAMGHSVFERWGGVDLWCHTSIHATALTPANHIDPKDLQKSIDINLTAAQALIESVDPLLRAKSGRAIYIRDDHATGKFFGTYGTTKAAQQRLFEHWTDEMSEAGLRVDGFTAKPMPTALRARFFPGEDRTALTDCQSEAARLIKELL